MAKNEVSDFAALLDELIASAESGPEPARPATIPFDYLSVVEELHSGRIRVSEDTIAEEYRQADATIEAFFAAAQQAQEEGALPSTEPAAIYSELGLDEAMEPEELRRRRRAFAFANHPDRVAPHLRQRAMVRMQVANMLFDEAARRRAR